jgi:hypothetical protein
VSQDFDALGTMITLGSVHAHLHDIDIETLDSAVFLTFFSKIVFLDRGSTFGRRDTDAHGSSGEPI